MAYIVTAFIVILVALGLIHFVRRQIATSREQLKQVDRDKLNDLDHDAWADEDQRQNNDLNNSTGNDKGAS